MENEILVSICCITYNHERFIRDALESFIMQQTDFGFEVLIHDDASTDATPGIIREYEKKYPDIIKPIYQTENQYSKGVAISPTYNYPRARGKYIAVCEGDDYFTDSAKLQRQAAYMEAHPECSLCVHSALKVDAEGKTVGRVRPSETDRAYTAEEVILDGGNLFATNSMFLRTADILARPAFFTEVSIGDYPLAVYTALCGEVYYLAETLSAYRVNIRGSWSSMQQSRLMEKNSRVNAELAAMLDQADAYSGYRYTEAVEKWKRKSRFDQAMAQGDLKLAKSGIYAEFYRSAAKKTKLRAYLQHLCPWLVRLYFRHRYR